MIFQKAAKDKKIGLIFLIKSGQIPLKKTGWRSGWQRIVFSFFSGGTP
jgi:hypothetical protein